MSARNSPPRSEEHTSVLQSHVNLVCRLLLEKKKNMSILVPFIWHIPQPFYKNPDLVCYCIPWAYLHGTKDYLGMPRFAEDFLYFFFNDTATTEIYTLSLHDALPI